MLDIIHNNALIQDLGSKKTRFVNLNRLRMYDISPEQWKKLKLTRNNERLDTVDEIQQPQKVETSYKEPAYASFDIMGDITCLNPEAAARSRPIPIKVEGAGAQGITGSSDLQHDQSKSFLNTFSDTLGATFGISPIKQTTGLGDSLESETNISQTLDLGKNSKDSQNILPTSPSSTGDTLKIKTGKGKSAGTIRIANLPSEQYGRLTREKAKNSNASIPPVFGDEFWRLNQNKKPKPD